ncbi:hypothetical protein D9M68_159150 [compost metagenome]
MTPTPVEVHAYRHGEAALVPVAEADPFGFWLVEMEASAHGLTSYYADGLLLAVTGYQLVWKGVADAFALVNRELAHGSGRELAQAVRQRIVELMASDGLHRVQATADCADRASQVFLRATGYRQEARMHCAGPDGRDLYLYAITRSPSP